MPVNSPAPAAGAHPQPHLRRRNRARHRRSRCRRRQVVQRHRWGRAHGQARAQGTGPDLDGPLCLIRPKTLPSGERLGLAIHRGGVEQGNEAAGHAVHQGRRHEGTSSSCPGAASRSSRSHRSGRASSPSPCSAIKVTQAPLHHIAHGRLPNRKGYDAARRARRLTMGKRSTGFVGRSARLRARRWQFKADGLGFRKLGSPLTGAAFHPRTWFLRSEGGRNDRGDADSNAPPSDMASHSTTI